MAGGYKCADDSGMNLDDSVAAQKPPPPGVAQLMHDEIDKECNGADRPPEDPARLDYARASNAGGIGGAQASEHHNRVLANIHILAQANPAEEVHQVMADRGVVRRPNLPKKVHYIMIGVPFNIDAAKKYDHVSIHGALDIHTAKETDSIVDGLVRGDIDRIAKLDDILTRPRRCCHRRSEEYKESSAQDAPCNTDWPMNVSEHGNPPARDLRQKWGHSSVEKDP